VLEPWLYGSSVGITPLALLLSSAMWTVLWGPVGLILAPAMTACMVIIGRHVPSLGFLDVLLGDREVLPAPLRFYQRLIAGDAEEAVDVAEDVAAKDGAMTALEDLAVAALAAVQQDRLQGVMRRGAVVTIASAVGMTATRIAEEHALPEPASADAPVPVIPVAGALDDAAAEIVAAALRCSGVAATAGAGESAGEPPFAVLATMGATELRLRRAEAVAGRISARILYVDLGPDGIAPSGGEKAMRRLGDVATTAAREAGAVPRTEKAAAERAAA
jgi:hypothetical protein